MVIVAAASNGREAVDLWKQYRPDVTLLDLRMPELDGVGAIKAIREVDPNAHIVVLTTYDSDEEIYGAIKAGAKAYLLKDTARDALVETVRRVCAGETYLPPPIAAKLAERVSGAALSQREMEVLQRMATGKSNKEIGAELIYQRRHREDARQQHFHQTRRCQPHRSHGDRNPPRFDPTLNKGC